PIRRPPCSPPFPYTTLFRSRNCLGGGGFGHGLGRGGRTRQGSDGSRRCQAIGRHTRLSCPVRGHPMPRAMPCQNTIPRALGAARSEEHTSELQSRENLVCRL